MAGDDDDFGYSDDDLDALPENALRDLETQAILSTQKQRAPVASNDVQTLPQYAQSRNARASRQAGRIGDSEAHAEPPSSDYGFGDEDVINLDEEVVDQPAVSDNRALPVRHGAVSQPRTNGRPNNRQNEQWRGSSNHQLYNTQTRAVDQATAREQHRLNRYADGGGRAAAAGVEHVNDTADPLEQDRIVVYENQVETLRKQLDEYKQLAHAKAGETAIVRRNYEKAIKESEQEISRLRQAHAEDLAKRTAELDAARREREKVETNNRFLEHDLAQEVGRTKQGRKTAKDAAGYKSRPAGTAATPKRNKGLLFGDGFDDGDVVMVSPSKSRDRSKASTPKNGAKRKRTIGEPSPGKPLPLTGSMENLQHQDSLDSDRPVSDSNAEISTIFSSDDSKFKFIQHLLNHKPFGSKRRTFEILATYELPSDPSTSLSSFIFNQTAQYENESATDFSTRFCEILLSLWEQCLLGTFFAPLGSIIDLLQYILESEPLRLAASIAERLLPLAIPTADLVAIPIGQASTNPEAFKNRKQTGDVDLQDEIDVYEIMSLLLTVAHACASSSEEANTRFWQHMKYDFILLMLMKAQPLPQIMLTLQMLCTSATKSTFGATLPDVGLNTEQQQKNESAIIDRLTNLLSEKPTSVDTGGAHPANEVADLRNEVLNVLGAMIVHDYGARILASHRFAIGRLMRLLDFSISTLYSVSPDTELHSKTVRIINLAMRILFHLLTNYLTVEDRKTKMSVIPGGNHRHVVALTRLAFSDALVLEQGIEEEVSIAAHELLDAFLSPEEGENLVQVYSTANSGA